MSPSVVYQCIYTNFCHSRSFFQPIFVWYVARISLYVNVSRPCPSWNLTLTGPQAE